MVAPGALIALAALLVAVAAPAAAARGAGGLDTHQPAAAPMAAWGPSYEVAYELEMPYFQMLQPGGFRYTAQVWVDEAAGATRVDYNGGLQRVLYVNGKEYQVGPHKYERERCRVFDDPSSGPRRRLLGRAGLAAPAGGAPGPLGAPQLPDLSAGGWVDVGRSEVNGQAAALWQRKDMKGQKMSTYLLYVSDSGAPLRLHAIGVDIIEGSHYDEYLYTFTSFRRGPVDAATWEIPPICAGADGAPTAPTPLAPASLGAGAQPGAAAAAPSRAFVKRHGRVNGAAARPEGDKAAPVFKGTRGKKGKLPRFFDWRGTPADVAVKDQAQCGSCWAFSATGSLEGQWFVHTGQSRSFSEQQLIDCAWDEGGHGCDGGDVRSAFDYVTAAGGISTTAAYPYTGFHGVCRDNTTAKEGFFDGFVRVDQDDESVMEALMRHGPLAIGIDADFDFGSYSDGIYYEDRCSTRPSRLNHAVILVGWGERNGTPYFIVRNTWSSLWGQDGYIFMHRGGNDCGVASDAVYATVAKAHVVPGAAERALQLGLARGRALRDLEEKRSAAARVAVAAASGAGLVAAS